MIRYTLACEAGHGFESWFPSNAAYDEQSARGLVTCPFCDSARVAKAPMAPAVARTDRGRAETPWAPIGLAICYDIRFPALYRALAEAGATILTAPACVTRQTGEAHWHILQRARAIETGSFMISAAQGGRHEDGRETFGHSLIVDPWGRILAEAAGDAPGVILAEIDLARVAEARARIPTLSHARSFGVRRA